MTPLAHHDLQADDKAASPGVDASAPGTLERKQTKHPVSDLTELASNYLKSLLNGDRQAACTLILEAVDRGVPIRDVYLGVFQPVQREVGRLWQINIVSVAVEHFCTAATQMVMSQLFPRILSPTKNGLSMVGCCVGEELHELGVRMVCDFFEMDGWDTHYMGSNCRWDSLNSVLETRHTDMLCLSVTMPQNLGMARKMIREAKARFPKTKVMVGGFPFQLNPGLAEPLGAHGWARDAEEALTLAKSLVRAA